MATQLSDLYVTISLEGLAKVMAELRAVKEELAKVKKPAAEMEDALGRLGKIAMAQMGPLGMLTGAVSALWKTFREVPKVKIPVLPRADGIPVLKPAGGGGMSAGAMAGFGAAIAGVAVAANAMAGIVGSAKDRIIGLARAGFEGTVEMNRYQFAMQLLGREVAGAFVPALNLMTSAVKSVTHSLASMGGTGQKVLAAVVIGFVLITSAVTAVLGLVIGLTAAVLGLTAAVVALEIVTWPVSIVILVVAAALAAVVVVVVAVVAAFVAVAGAIYLAYTESKEFRTAVLNLKGQLVALLTALEPVGAALLKVGGFLAQVFVIGPLTNFLDALSLIVALLERAVKMSMLLKILPKDSLGGGKRTDVTLNQTGEESAAGSFQRIQQSILKYESPEESEEHKQTDALERIENWLSTRFGGQSASLNPPSPGSIVGGSSVAGDGSLGGAMKFYTGGR